MKQKWIALICGAMLVAAIGLTGCGESSTTESSTAPVVSTSSQTESTASESTSSAAQSSTESETSDPVLEEAFEKKFEENPIDAAYNQQSEEVTTNQEMIALESTYAGLWKSEISHAYQLLMEKQTCGNGQQEIEADQKAWNDGLEDAIAKIKSEAGDGTNGTLESAMGVKNLYRDKAKELYSQLYQCDPDYDYIYTPY